MSHNTFGHLFRVTTFGESHGVAIGCVVDGCPPGIPLEAAEIQAYLDKRKPGQSRFTTQRREADNVRMLSGVFSDDMTRQQVTTGTPIALLSRIPTRDQRITATSGTNTGPATGISLTMSNTACAIIAAAAELQPARPHAALRQGRSREKCSRM